jgi:hypothetical protein
LEQSDPALGPVTAFSAPCEHRARSNPSAKDLESVPSKSITEPIPPWPSKLCGGQSAKEVVIRSKAVDLI